MTLPRRSFFCSRHTATNCQHPHKPASSGLRLARCSRQRANRPCSLVQPESYSPEKKSFGQVDVSPLQNAALVALESPEIIGCTILSTEMGGLILEVCGAGIGSPVVQTRSGECSSQ